MICYAYRGLDVCHVMYVMTRSKVPGLEQPMRYFTREFRRSLAGAVPLSALIQTLQGVEHGTDNRSKHYGVESERSSSR